MAAGRAGHRAGAGAIRPEDRRRHERQRAAALRGGGTASVWCSFESAEEQGVTAVTTKGTYTLERPFTAWQDPHDPYQLMVESFADSVRDGTEPEVSLDESVANMRTLDRIREAMQL